MITGTISCTDNYQQIEICNKIAGMVAEEFGQSAKIVLFGIDKDISTSVSYEDSARIAPMSTQLRFDGTNLGSICANDKVVITAVFTNLDINRLPEYPAFLNKLGIIGSNNIVKVQIISYKNGKELDNDEYLNPEDIINGYKTMNFGFYGSYDAHYYTWNGRTGESSSWSKEYKSYKDF